VKERVMRLLLGTALVILCSVAAASAHAAVCLDKSMTIDEIVEAINKTPNCERAMKLAQDCSLGSGGDTRLGAAVEKKCEADFLSGLKPPSKAAYKRELASATGNTGTSPAPCTSRSRRSAARRSPSVIPGAR
jgi:hypothetical protein